MRITVLNGITDFVNVVARQSPYNAGTVFGVAMLSNLMPVNLYQAADDELAEYEGVAFFVDIGGEYAPDRGRFDYHDPRFRGERANGIKYSAAGLIWKQYGPEITSAILFRARERPSDDAVREIAAAVDRDFVSGLDAHAREQDAADDRYLGIAELVERFNLLSPDQIAPAQAFAEACNTASRLLELAVLEAAHNLPLKLAKKTQT